MAHSQNKAGRPTTHGLSHSVEHRTWSDMISRCSNTKRPNYKHYGGRGITVCDRWLNSFIAFYEDMGPRPANRSIDRIDNNKGYSKENCRWATSKEQTNNRRPVGERAVRKPRTKKPKPPKPTKPPKRKRAREEIIELLKSRGEWPIAA